MKNKKEKIDWPVIIFIIALVFIFAYAGILWGIVFFIFGTIAIGWKDRHKGPLPTNNKKNQTEEDKVRNKAKELIEEYKDIDRKGEEQKKSLEKEIDKQRLEKNKGVDERKAECPNCHYKLKKVPGAKTKCPNCNEFMYVRTRPQDQNRVVVTQEQADKIDEDWRIINGTQEEFLEKQKEFNDRKELLKRKFGGKEPSDTDVQWSMLNESLLEYAKKGQWGAYTSARREMAEIHKKEGRLKDALRMYLGVCYLELNGPNNMMIDEKGNVVGGEYEKPFEPDIGYIPPGILNSTQQIIKKLEPKKEEIKDLYFDFAYKIKETTGAPLIPEDCFDKIEKLLYEQQS